jgi:hypothetical protein
MEEIQKGPLEGWVVDRLERLWKTVENDAAQDNFGTYKKLAASGGFEGVGRQT